MQILKSASSRPQIQNPKIKLKIQTLQNLNSSTSIDDARMPIFKSLIKTLIRNSPKPNRTFFTNAVTSWPPVPLILSPHRTRLATLPKWAFPISGPLFLSGTPWKLPQTATPLYLQCDDILLKTKAKALNLLETAYCLPSTFRIEKPVNDDGIGLDRVRVVEDKDGGGGGGVGKLVQSFVNLPNFISMSRLISGPVLGWMIVNEWYTPAFLGLVVSGATDWLDGYVARKININSVVGSYLDPLADKVLIGCVAVAMVHNDLLHSGLAALVVLRDVTLVGGAVYQRGNSLGWELKSWLDFFNLDGTHPQKVEPLFISKVNTVFQLALVAAALLRRNPSLHHILKLVSGLYYCWFNCLLRSTVLEEESVAQNGSLNVFTLINVVGKAV